MNHILEFIPNDGINYSIAFDRLDRRSAAVFGALQQSHQLSIEEIAFKIDYRFAYRDKVFFNIHVLDTPHGKILNDVLSVCGCDNFVISASYIYEPGTVFATDFVSFYIDQQTVKPDFDISF